MQVQEPVPRGGEQLDGEELPERDHDADICVECAHLFRDLACPGGRDDGEPERQRLALHRARLELAPAAAAAIGLRDDEGHVVTGIAEGAAAARQRPVVNRSRRRATSRRSEATRGV